MGLHVPRPWRETLAMFLWWVRFPPAPLTKQTHDLVTFNLGR